ncbi:enoyl-CoA hydratase-related protein [Novosphingobium sp. 9U]|uniref:enoyl-CoA hydratase-related protein n=1 Tax=Novosphingobium sp. 9U TaxID=2653158 RepID=UPI00352CF79C
MIRFKTIKLDVEDCIAIITLNRPEQMNAFTLLMCQELIQAFEITDSDDSMRAVIFTGEGTSAFCAGADLSAGADTFNYGGETVGGPVRLDGSIDWAHVDVRDAAGRVTLRVFRSLKPVICRSTVRPSVRA